MGKRARKTRDTHVRMWLIYTGCGFDLVSRPDIKPIEEDIEKADFPQSFSTANGSVEADEQCPVQIDELSVVAHPYLLPSTRQCCLLATGA